MTPIDKLGWVHIQDRKVLFIRTTGKDAFYHPGGKREGNESDAEALVREIKEELNVDLVPETITYVTSLQAQAHGQPSGTFVEIKYYAADFTGTLKPSAEIAEMRWFTSNYGAATSEAGKLFLAWLQQQNLID